MAGVRLGVFDEHEIFRRGVLACVCDHPDITAISDPAAGPFDLAVVSITIASARRLDCPLLVCAPEDRLTLEAIPNRVAGVLSRTSVTPDQLLGAIRAAAAGLTVMVASSSALQRAHTTLDPRARAVLKMLAAGQDTHQIADDLGFSERTIKHAITLILAEFGARNRAQAVAEGIRLGVI
jgi:DNA-binding NarL/FixJ family response regulator